MAWQLFHFSFYECFCSRFQLNLSSVCCLLSRGWKDREGADCQSGRDRVSCDAHGQEDGRPLCGCVQWGRQTLHACGHGEMLDSSVLRRAVSFVIICFSVSALYSYTVSTFYTIRQHVAKVVFPAQKLNSFQTCLSYVQLETVCFCIGFFVGRWSLSHRPCTLPAELPFYGESFGSGQAVWITCE